ncbi:hypothetical protein A3L04_04875 [Thermococcus chitonophagus]|uniref:DUF1177 domain-containing protein n=2 Tax=Thermococcus chitonophagus TaxID=54262 RepID=A0A160VX21_9EURY|nr:hypothetical protein A3L04_04875 [Thermococcus chitonophagus]CUX78551.1 FIG01125393: hypothetical protein [Thermococcus chitonophagus]
MLKQVIEAYELLDSARVDGYTVADFLKGRGVKEVEVTTIEGEKGSTDFVKIVIPGKDSKAPKLGIIGRLGGIGARPERIGLVSDADGAITAIAVALKLADMQSNGDILPGDVIISTHICPDAPTKPHEPVPFMDSPVDIATMNKYEVDKRMDAILSIDTTKGNRIINIRGFAITPTIKEGWILRVSEDLLDIMEYVTGRMPAVVPITMQDITPYGNGIYHINSIVQPATATDAPVVGVAITAEVPVPGCATGASHEIDIELAGRFCIEVAKGFGAGKVKFYDEDEFRRLVELYGSMKHLQTLGRLEK